MFFLKNYSKKDFINKDSIWKMLFCCKIEHFIKIFVRKMHKNHRKSWFFI